MCKPKTPKVKPVEEKEIQVLHNPYLDGTFDNLRIGRAQLRSDAPRAGFPSPAGVGVATPNLSAPAAGVLPLTGFTAGGRRRLLIRR